MTSHQYACVAAPVNEGFSRTYGRLTRPLGSAILAHQLFLQSKNWMSFGLFGF
jgi:hypothetical protein